MTFKEKIVKLCFLILFVYSSNSLFAAPTATQDFDWQPVIDAIIQVESHGNAKAKKGNSVGAMQITPILVRECNNILESRKEKKRFSLADRYNVTKSREMFLIMQSQFNPENNIEKAIRAWNGGNNYSKRRTQRYYEKVMAVLNAGK